MRVCTLASGSSGNSLYIESSNTRILVDAGIGPRILKKRLQSIDVDIGDLDGIIVTHEHEDHTRSITKTDAPVYVASETVPLWKGKVERLMEFESDSAFDIKDLHITPFSVPHDAIDPVGFTIETGNIKIGLVTDLGDVTRLVLERLRECGILIIESNHDINLLHESSYPWDLKQRIKSRNGHLSNMQSSSLLNTVFHKNLKHVILAHLSKINNSPEAAYSESMKIINRKDSNGTTLHIAPRNDTGEVLCI